MSVISFDQVDFESLNGNYPWSNGRIKRIRNKLEYLKQPLHEKLKNKFGIDFKSNIGGGYPYGESTIHNVWLSFTERKDRAYVPYPQLNVGIRAKGVEVFFLLIDKARAKTGQRIWKKYCNNLKNGLEQKRNTDILITLIEKQDFGINDDNIKFAIKNIDTNGIWVYKKINKNSVIKLQSKIIDEIFGTLELLYPIYRIAMSSKTPK